MIASNRCRRLIPAGIVALTLIATAACSSKSGTTSSSSAPGSAAATSAAASTTSAASASAGSGSPAASGSAPSADSAANIAKVCAAGSTEGEVDIARGTDADVFANEIKPFQQKYPDIKVKYTSLKPQDNVQRVLAEVQTGHALDLDGTDFDIPSAQPLFQANLVASIDWSSLGVSSDMQINYQGINMARTDVLLGGISYDKSKTDPSTLPSTWDQLIDPKWAGKIIVDTRGKQLSPLSLVWGEQKTLDWYTNFEKTDKPIGVNGATASLQKVMDGEAVLSTSAHDAEVAQLDASGATAGIKYLDIVPAFTEYTYILTKAPHPNAIRCYYAWRLSAEGQAQIMKYEFKGDTLTPADLPAGAKLASDLTADQGKLDAKVAGELAKLSK